MMKYCDGHIITHLGDIDMDISYVLFNVHIQKMVSFIFVGFNFRGLTDTGMFVDILIHGFDTCE